MKTNTRHQMANKFGSKWICKIWNSHNNYKKNSTKLF